MIQLCINIIIVFLLTLRAWFKSSISAVMNSFLTSCTKSGKSMARKNTLFDRFTLNLVHLQRPDLTRHAKKMNLLYKDQYSVTELLSHSTNPYDAGQRVRLILTAETHLWWSCGCSCQSCRCCYCMWLMKTTCLNKWKAPRVCIFSWD